MMTGKKFMITALFIMLFTMCILTGCSAKEKITGTWQDENDTVTFDKDGSFNASYYWWGGSYAIDGDHITLSPMLVDDEDYTYSIQGDILILSDVDSKEEIYRFEKVK